MSCAGAGVCRPLHLSALQHKVTQVPTLRLQQPTVSASSSSFSCPARSANLSMKYMATPICWAW